MVVENFEAVSLLDVVVSRFVAEGGQPKNLDKTNKSNLSQNHFMPSQQGGGVKGTGPLTPNIRTIKTRDKRLFYQRTINVCANFSRGGPCACNSVVPD